MGFGGKVDRVRETRVEESKGGNEQDSRTYQVVYKEEEKSPISQASEFLIIYEPKKAAILSESSCKDTSQPGAQASRA